MWRCQCTDLCAQQSHSFKGVMETSTSMETGLEKWKLMKV